MNKPCPYKPGDVIWYVFGMPGGDYVPRLVISVDGGSYSSYDPFLNKDVECQWSPNTGHSIGATGLSREHVFGQSDREKIAARAARSNLSLRFKSD